MLNNHFEVLSKYGQSLEAGEELPYVINSTVRLENIALIIVGILFLSLFIFPPEHMASLTVVVAILVGVSALLAGIFKTIKNVFSRIDIDDKEMLISGFLKDKIIPLKNIDRLDYQAGYSPHNSEYKKSKFFPNRKGKLYVITKDGNQHLMINFGQVKLNDTTSIASFANQLNKDIFDALNVSCNDSID
ncbi:MAG: hypothetical protein HRT71_15720 [Flavobacteriales bacterium]|nr:hypothetical protein [Flavobacteriales bacterium]